MQDIIPSGRSGAKFAGKKSVPDAVALTWKLPARLRKPIREELRRQEIGRRQRESIVRFERRPISTQLASDPPPQFRKRATSGERHTGDVYMSSRPDIHLPLPPYAGGRRSQSRVGGHQAPGAAQALQSKISNPQHSAGRIRRRRAARGSPRVRQSPVSQQARTAIAVERDVPYEFAGDGTTDAIVGERPRLQEMQRAALNVPASWLEQSGEAVLSQASRLQQLFGLAAGVRSSWSGGRQRMALNLGVLLVGCLLVFGAVWNLRSLGRGALVFESVRQQASEAYGRVLSGSSALAETDFEESEKQFSDARAMLAGAQSELNEALASSEAILRYVDVTGTVRSGQDLLAAGEKLAAAGEHVSRGVELLLAAGEEAGGGRSIVGALEDAGEDLAAASKALGEAEEALAGVSSILLPDDVQAQVEALESSIPGIREAIDGFLDQSEVLATIIGAERERQYLFLFENNHEIRPTGGFIGSIALVDIDRGVVEEIDVQTVYDPDGQLKEFIVPPDPLLPITNRWYLRDANWFVDYPASARKIGEFFEKEGGPTVDGIVALTPEVIRELLRVTGPIEVPAYGVTVDADNFSVVTQDQVSYSYDQELNRPKQFLADLTPLLLNRLFSLSADSALATLTALANMVQEKHLLLYFNDDELQRRLSAAGWAGEVPREQQGFLAVNNANVAGHKSDQFIEQEIDYRLEVQEDGSVDVVTTIRRTHRGPEEALDFDYPEQENPATKDNIVWQRLLVPDGAELLDAQGFTPETDIPRLVLPRDSLHGLVADPDLVEWQRSQLPHPSGTKVGREAGYTFFANWMNTKPGMTTVGLYRYRLPDHAAMPHLFDPVKGLEAMVYKQPGDTRTSVRVSITLPESMRIVHTVPGDGITQDSDRSLVYRGQLKQDVLTGVVFERR